MHRAVPVNEERLYRPIFPSMVRVREPQSLIQLALQDAAFRGQIFVPRQQLLIHRPGNVGKDVRLPF